MVSIGLGITSVFVSLEQNKLSSKFMPYTQPYYNQAFFNQQYPYSTPDYYTNFDPKNLTIEVLPNDDEDEDDGYLKFGLLRDAYGYGDSIHTKKWNTGFLRATSNHGSVSLTLYELDESSNSCGKAIDRFDVFDGKSNALSGREFITGRNLIDVQGFVGQKNNKSVGETPVARPKIRAGLQRHSKSSLTPYKRPQKCSDVAVKPSPLPSFEPTFEPRPTKVFRPVHHLPTSNVNVSEIIKNIELMLDEN
ncbi:hypothetical protein MACJ_001189 [Theileria orientalis]|uniref:Microprotein domain-containing protein n=1 Tax=Theileria orientalis TaxID=68886 RepID=A0A976QRB8_THEOR|nr:hypothetical protein MACJ_001189 [Theileria orientalis]